jgi:copper chaperone CopZ
MKEKIFIPDIECDSCTKLLNRKFKNIEGVEEFTIENDGIEVQYDREAVSSDKLIKNIQSLGFRASLNPFERKNFRERMRDMRENRGKYATMRKAFWYSIFIFLILLGLQAIAYFGFLSSIPDFLAKFGIWLFYLDISVAALAASAWYMYTQKGHITCMTGMMIGMTLGMQTGMMIGAVHGAVNGFFIGAMVGMLSGTIVGFISGSSCGNMGIMQGMMAGIMGGTMGPMITMMMFTDHVKIFMPFYIVINLLILAGFIYMYFEEVVENKKIVKRDVDFMSLAAISVIVTFALTALLVYGPKSVLFGG